MKLKIMTYNIASGHCYDREDTSENYYYDLSKTASVIRGFQPDICGMNEVDQRMKRTNRDEQTPLMAELTGMPEYAFFKATAFEENGLGEYGNAILSRFPMIEKEIIPVPDPEIRDNPRFETRSIGKAVFELPDCRTLTLLQTHFGLMPSEKMNMLNTLVPLIDSINGPLILMGDFNITAEENLLDPIRERLTDTAAFSDRPLITYPSYRCDDFDRQIDYIFVSRHIKPLSIVIGTSKASDHRPYFAEIEL